MRHPPAWFYWLFLGAPVLIGLVHAIRIWTSTESTSSIVYRIPPAIIIALIPITILLLCGLIFAGFIARLGTFRKGNRVEIIAGEHRGETGFVLQRFGLHDAGDVSIHLPQKDVDILVSPFGIRKVGLRSHLW